MLSTKTSRLAGKGLFLLFVILFFNSCSNKGDDGPDPIPTPTEVTYTDNIVSDREGQTFYHFKGGKILAQGTTDNDAKTAELKFTQNQYDKLAINSTTGKSSLTGKNSNQIVIDSTIGRFGGFNGTVIYKEEGRTLNNGTNTKNITNEQLLYSHVFKGYGQGTGTAEAYIDGKSVGKVDIPEINFRSRIVLPIFDTNNTTTIDSIIVTDAQTGATGVVKNITITDELEYIGEGVGGEILLDNNNTTIGTTGDFAIVPLLDSDDDGVGDTPVFNTTITARNMMTDKTYEITTAESIAEFNDVDVTIGNPEPYEITIASNEADPNYFTTIKEVFIFRDDVETGNIINGSKEILVDKVTNQVDFKVVVRDFNNINQKVMGYAVELRNFDTDELLQTRITNEFEEIEFAYVPGSTNVYLVGRGTNYYTKANGKYSIPKVERVSQARKTLNIVAVQKFNDRDGVPVSADDINMYKPLKDNTEAALDKLRIYFPEASGDVNAIQNLNDAANLLGVDLTVSRNFQGYPSQNMVDSYNPYPQERQVFDGQIETNVTGYAGTGTGTIGKVLPNGNEISFYTSTFDLGGTRASDHHEFGNLLNFPLLSGFNTSRAELAGVTTSIDDSKLDSAIMPLWIQLQKYHYNSTDSENNLIEYNMATKFEE
tara:strand:- start:975 stop:2939 length:1965 start_codon:yes stop_codon:yes gene_type:complete